MAQNATKKQPQLKSSGGADRDGGRGGGRGEEDDDSFGELDLRRHWFTQSFEAAAVDSRHQRRQLRSAARVACAVAAFCSVENVLDIIFAGSSSTNTSKDDDLLQFVATILRCVYPFVAGVILVSILCFGMYTHKPDAGECAGHDRAFGCAIPRKLRR